MEHENFSYRNLRISRCTPKPNSSHHHFALHSSLSSLVWQTVKTKVDKAPKVNPYLLIAGGLVLSCIISMCLLVPAVIFFPVTIFLGVATSFALIALAPVAFVFGWILISSAPIQDKVVVPALDKVLANKKVAKFLLKE